MADDTMDIFMHAERIQESGDDYSAFNTSGHFGAYQFDVSTWDYALSLAGLQYLAFAGILPDLAPSSVQDAAARALMSKYYGEFGSSYYNVAEAWYGGPGAVGHPDESGGAGEPTVGQYATDVMNIYYSLGGPGAPAVAAPPTGGGYTAATLLELLLAVNQERVARIDGDTHEHDLMVAGVLQEAIERANSDTHEHDLMVAGVAQEATARVNGITAEHDLMVAGIKQEATERTNAITAEHDLMVAGIAQEATARTNAITAEHDLMVAGVAQEATARVNGITAEHDLMVAGIKQEATERIAQYNTVLSYAQSLPGLVDNRAAAGYDPTLASRATLVQKLLDTVVAHDPTVSGLVSDLAGFLVDLAGVEDPVARIAAQLVLKQVIDRLGINTALGAMVNDLIGGIFGGGAPKTLTAVTGDIGSRLNALEEGQADLAPLDDEADKLHEMGGLVFDAGLLAYFAGAVVSPVATANDTVAAFAPVTGPLLAPVRALLGM